MALAPIAVAFCTIRSRAWRRASSSSSVYSVISPPPRGSSALGAAHNRYAVSMAGSCAPPRSRSALGAERPALELLEAGAQRGRDRHRAPGGVVVHDLDRAPGGDEPAAAPLGDPVLEGEAGALEPRRLDPDVEALVEGRGRAVGAGR